METTLTSTYRCPICRHCSEHSRLRSDGAFEAIDLDLRPSVAFRGPLDQWLLECPKCLYVSNGEDSRPTKNQEPWLARHGPFIKRGILRRVTELEQILCQPLSPTANRFMRRSIIEEQLRRDWLASYHALSAAWVCDDAGEVDLAVACRMRVARGIRAALASSGHPEAATAMRLVLIDVLRRSWLFNEARNEAVDLAEQSPLDDLELGVLRYQLVLIDNEVRSREQIASAFE